MWFGAVGEHFAGIHDVVGIKRLLDHLHDGQGWRVQFHADVRGLGGANAVLAAD